MSSCIGKLENLVRDTSSPDNGLKEGNEYKGKLHRIGPHRQENAYTGTDLIDSLGSISESTMSQKTRFVSTVGKSLFPITKRGLNIPLWGRFASGMARAELSRFILAGLVLFVCAGQSCMVTVTELPEDPSPAGTDDTGTDLGTDTGTQTEPTGGDGDDDEVAGFHPEPEIVIDAPSSVVEGELVVLDASGSFTPRSTALSYMWTQIAGPSIDIIDPEAATIGFIAPEVDEATGISFELNVDDTVATASDVVSVTIEDSIDLAGLETFVIDFTVGEGEESLRVDFVGSTESGDPLPAGLYFWDFGDGSTAEGASVSHNYTQAGLFHVLFCVTVGTTVVGCDESEVEVVDPPVTDPPVGGGGGGAPPPDGTSGVLTVDNLGDLESSGVQKSGSYTPASKSYTLSNSGDDSLNWRAEKNVDWITLSVTDGTLDPGASFTVNVLVDDDADSLAPGDHTGTIQFINTSNGAGSTSRQATISILAPGSMAITAGPFSSSGEENGPFSPTSKTYYISNPGTQPINWAVNKSATWLTLSTSSGTVLPGGVKSVIVSLNATADSLSANIYNDTLTFTNTTNHQGDTTRGVDLTVSAPGGLVVTPFGDFSSSGTEGGPFSPTSRTYTLANTGQSPLAWNVNINENWLSLSKTSGTLAAGSSDTVVVNLVADAGLLTAGDYVDTLEFVNTTSSIGNTTRDAELSVLEPGAMVVTAGDFTSSGMVGGPFSPATKTYTIGNPGQIPINWSVSKSANWISLSSSSGTLSPGQSQSILVNFNANADGLSASTYSDTLTFTNTTNHAGDATRNVELAILAAGQLSVTTSDHFVSTGPEGGPFSPTSKSYTLSNTGDVSIDWSLNKSATWLSASKSGGTIAPDASVTVIINVNSSAESMAAGDYSDTVTFTNTTNHLGDTTRDVDLTILTPGTLAVTPSGDFAANGYVGGPFLPISKTYTLTNTGDVSMNWSLSKSVSWVNLSLTGGTLGAGSTQQVIVTVNSNANGLVASDYSGTLTFTNTTNGLGNTKRTANLSVVTPGSLEVTPATAFDASGTYGGPFSPESKTYTLSNPGGESINWAATVSESWMTAFPNGGTLAAGGTQTVIVSLNANADNLAANTYNETVTFTNLSNHLGDATRDVNLTVNAVPGALQITPGGGFSASGTAGGPFSPVDKSYTVTNSGGVSINWTASKTAAWLSLSSTGGTLAPGASTTVTAGINANANSLTANTYTDAITFTNTTNGSGSGSRDVDLVVINEVADGRVTDDLVVLYDFNEGTGTTVLDRAAGGTPIHLDVADAGNVSWTTGGLSIDADTVLLSSQPATKLVDAVKASNEVTIETWINPANTTQGGPARLFTVSESSSSRNITLGQDTDSYEIRLRSASTSINGIPAVNTPAGDVTTNLTHLVYTRSASGVVRVYINGNERVDTSVTGNLSSWDATHKLALANEVSLGRAWLGEFYLVAAYSRALSLTEVQQNFAAGSEADTGESAGPGVLTLSSSTGLTSSGDVGGPFAPTSKTYTLSNTGGDSLDWTVSRSASWLALSSVSGTLAPGATKSVTVSLTSAADALAVDTYTDTLSFTNTTDGSGSTTRSVSLTVKQPGTSQAMTTASRTSGVMPLGVFFDVINDSETSWNSNVIQPRGFDDQPTIPGVRITRVEYGTPLGQGTLSYTASSKSLRWQASGEAAGTTVSVSDGGSFALPSGAGRNLHVWVTKSQLAASNQSDTIEIVDGGINADWASFHYEWDFGNPAPGGTPNTDSRWYWEHGAKKSDGSRFAKNKAFGWNAAHVYENAGTYNVTLRVIDDTGGEHEYTQTITVSEEPTGGWTTYYFAAHGNDTTGDGSQSKPYETWDKAVSFVGENVRLLFKRGDTFAFDSDSSITVTGPCQFGAYGSGSRPRFIPTTDAGLIGTGRESNDVRFVDLDVQGGYPTRISQRTAFHGSGTNALYLRCTANSMNSAFGMTGEPYKIIADCTASNNKSYGFWDSKGTNVAVLGCQFTDGNTEHLLRVYNSKTVVQHSSFARPLEHKRWIRFMTGTAHETWWKAKWNIASFNTAPSDMSIACDLDDDSRHRHMLVEHNVVGNVTARSNDRILIRNNVFTGKTAIHLDTQNHINHYEQVYVFNNTSYSDEGSGLRFFRTEKSAEIDGDVSDWRIKNNVAYYPNSSPGVAVLDFATDSAANSLLDSDYNCWRAPNMNFAYDANGSKSFAAWQNVGQDTNSTTSDPLFTNVTNGNFTLKSISPCREAGTLSIAHYVRISFDGLRRGSAKISMGAH